MAFSLLPLGREVGERERGRERLEVCNEGPVPGGRGAGESRRWNQEGHLWAIREK